MPGTLLEERLGAEAQTGRPSRAQLRLVRELSIILLRFERAFRIDILKVLNRFGEEIERVALEVLDNQTGKDFGYNINPIQAMKRGRARVWDSVRDFIFEHKDAGQDAMDAALINEALDMAGIEKDLTIVYERHYKRILKATQKSIGATLNLGITIVDPTEAMILSQGGKRVGLLDITGKTKRKIFEQLSQGRLDGESVPQLARRLRDVVPAGRFKKASTRATLIARTETNNAQKMAAVETYKVNNVTMVLIMDSRKGSFDDECDRLNGKLVSLAEGEQLMNDEHPNGTRMMVAQPPEIVEE